jgi:hypothetical protein
MQAHLLDGVGDVRSGEGEVLKRAGQAPVGRRIGDRGSVVLWELRLSVDSRGAGLAVGHASPLQYVDGVLALMEEETLGPMLGGDAEEEAEERWVATTVGKKKKLALYHIGTLTLTGVGWSINRLE